MRWCVILLLGAVFGCAYEPPWQPLPGYEYRSIKDRSDCAHFSVQTGMSSDVTCRTVEA